MTQGYGDSRARVAEMQGQGDSLLVEVEGGKGLQGPGLDNGAVLCERGRGGLEAHREAGREAGRGGDTGGHGVLGGRWGDRVGLRGEFWSEDTHWSH